jgi:hypothetical protein
VAIQLVRDSTSALTPSGSLREPTRCEPRCQRAKIRKNRVPGKSPYANQHLGIGGQNSLSLAGMVY